MFLYRTFFDKQMLHIHKLKITWNFNGQPFRESNFKIMATPLQKNGSGSMQ